VGGSLEVVLVYGVPEVTAVRGAVGLVPVLLPVPVVAGMEGTPPPQPPCFRSVFVGALEVEEGVLMLVVG